MPKIIFTITREDNGDIVYHASDGPFSNMSPEEKRKLVLILEHAAAVYRAMFEDRIK